MSGKKEHKLSFISKAYLALYNAASFFGWFYVFFLAAKHIKEGGHYSGVWNAVEMPIKVIQTAALLEIFHSREFLGLVRSSASTTIIQVFSRVAILWGVIALSTDAQTSIWAALTIFAWSIAELPRYSFYVFEILGISPPSLLVWIRYSAFLILYPAGISGEIGSLISSLSQIKANDSLGIHLPNKYNFAYNHFYALLFTLLLYIPGSPTMIGHMWKQRVSKLGITKVPKAKVN